MIRLLLVVIVVALGLGWWYWTTTPEYSIREAKSAIKGHDVIKFKKYVDVESVASGMVDSFTAGPVREMSSLGFVGRVLTFGIVSLLKPVMVDSMQNEIIELVEKGPLATTTGSNSSQEDAGTEPSTTSVGDSGISLKRSLRTFGFKGKVFDGIEYSRRDGKLALVGLKLYNQKYKRDVILEVRLRDMGGYWQVIGLPNLTAMLQTLIKLELNYQGGEKTETSSHVPSLASAGYARSSSNLH